MSQNAINFVFHTAARIDAAMAPSLPVPVPDDPDKVPCIWPGSCT